MASEFDCCVENYTDILQTTSVSPQESTVSSELEEDGIQSTALVVLRTCFVTMNAIFIMMANAFCIHVVKISRYMSIASKIFTIALAITDFTSGVRISVDMIAPSILNYWPYGEAYCQVSADFVIGLGSLSLSYLILLGIDRLVAITKGLRYHQIMTKKRALVAATMPFVVNVALYFPLPLDLRAKSPIPYPKPEFKAEVGACVHSFIYVRLEHFLIFLTISFIIPVIIALNIYAILLITAARHRAKVSTHLSKKQKTSLNGSILMFSLAMLGACISFTPFVCLLTYESATHQSPLEWIEFWFLWMAISNSWWNVVIYANSNRLWRKDAARVLRQLKRKICMTYKI